MHRTDQLYSLEWFDQYIPEKILGHYFQNVDCAQLNWNHKVEKIKNIVTSWQQRDLTYQGRALLINALMTSTLWYNVTSLPVPSWVVTEVEQIIYGFFWNNKRPCVQRHLCIAC